MDYTCQKCGMGVTGLRCVKCSKELVHATNEKNGVEIHVSKCPAGHGMIKSDLLKCAILKIERR